MSTVQPGLSSGKSVPAGAPVSARRIGIAGGSVVGVAFGMARYGYALTLPDVRRDLRLSEQLLGEIAGATYLGFLAGLMLAGPLTARRGPRAPTTLGGCCAILGALGVAFAPTPAVLAAGVVLAGSAAGWVWTPYSDIVAALVPTKGSSLLAAISTGTSAGLVLLGVVSIVVPTQSWRLIWGITALCAAVALIVNIVTIPRLPAPARTTTRIKDVVSWRVMLRPLAFTVMYFGASTVYFTFVSDATADSALGGAAGAISYITVGVSGTAALMTPRIQARLGGSRPTAAACLAAVGVAIGLLAVLGHSVPLILFSAALFGVGYMSGSAVLAMWTAELSPTRPAATFTLALLAGTLSAILTPIIVGVTRNQLGIPVLLLITCASTLLTAVGVVFSPASTGLWRR